MTPHVTFLAGLPVRAILDGELRRARADGKLDLPLLCEGRAAGDTTEARSRGPPSNSNCCGWTYVPGPKAA
jgi:hypothetical protein